MKQIIVIGGGEVFENREVFYERIKDYSIDPYKKKKKWKSWLIDSLWNKYEVFVPEMPNKRNADYNVWKMRFEKYFSFLHDEECVLVGSSLGGSFLLKWLGENTFPKAISQLHLVAPASSNDGLVDEVLGNFEPQLESCSHLISQCHQIFVYHSTDDAVVPYLQTEKLMEFLPGVTLEKFETRGHFQQPAFPELLQNIGCYKR